jgi:hypothetical protein
MIEQGRERLSSGAERGAGALWRIALRRISMNSSLSSGVQIGTGPRIAVEESKGDDLNKLLVLLVAVTLACGVAVGVTMTHVPAVAEDSGNGY